MADKGIGINECPTHGEYYLDAEDSPCPVCEDGVPDLGPTHYNCCHAPKDMGHMFGCPNSPENEPDKEYRVVCFIGVPCDPSEFESMTLDEAKAEIEHQSMMQPENRYEIQPIEEGGE